jgi:DNA-binding GntR family transcriptional regulator
MKLIGARKTLLEKVHEAILAEISCGKLSAGTRIIQEQLATELGVSRQPVQQALLLLKQQGVLEEAKGRGLLVTTLHPDQVRNIFEVRSAIEGLACRKAAELSRKEAAKLGPPIIRAGRLAIKKGSCESMISADMKFHMMIYKLSQNPLIDPAMDSYWVYTRRVMGHILTREEKPRDIWDQHEETIEAIINGNSKKAEAHIREHITQGGLFVETHLREAMIESK